MFDRVRRLVEEQMFLARRQTRMWPDSTVEKQNKEALKEYEEFLKFLDKVHHDK